MVSPLHLAALFWVAPPGGCGWIESAAAFRWKRHRIPVDTVTNLLEGADTAAAGSRTNSGTVLASTTSEKNNQTTTALTTRTTDSLNRIILSNLLRRDEIKNQLHTREFLFHQRAEDLRNEISRLSREIANVLILQTDATAEMPEESALTSLQERFSRERKRCDTEIADMGREKERKQAEFKERKEMFVKYFGASAGRSGGDNSTTSAGSDSGESGGATSTSSAETACAPYDEDSMDFLVGETQDALLTLAETEETTGRECKQQLEDLTGRIQATKRQKTTARRKLRHAESLRKRLTELKSDVERDLLTARKDFRKAESAFRQEMKSIADNTCAYQDVRNQLAPQTEDCEMSAWEEKTFCTKECSDDVTGAGRGEATSSSSGGKQLLQRSIAKSGTAYGIKCDTFPVEKEVACNQQKCGVDCEVGEWTGWSECGALCGEGSVSRTRDVLRHAQWGGTACPAVVERKPCVAGPCNADCVVEAEWSPKGGDADAGGAKASTPTCSRACGGGVFAEARKVLTPAAGTQGKCAKEKTERLSVCNAEACSAGDAQKFECGAQNLLVLFDESGSMNRTVVSAFRSALTQAMERRIVDYGRNVRLAEIGFATKAKLLPEPAVDQKSEKIDEATLNEYDEKVGGGMGVSVDGMFLQRGRGRVRGKGRMTAGVSSTTPSNSSTTAPARGNAATRVASALRKARDTFQEIKSSRASARKLREAELAKVPGGLAMAQRFGINLNLVQPAGKDLVVLFSDGIWSHKHLIREEFGKLEEAEVKMVLVGTDENAKGKLETFVGGEGLGASGKIPVFVKDDLTGILSGMCEEAVGKGTAGAGSGGNAMASNSTGAVGAGSGSNAAAVSFFAEELQLGARDAKADASRAMADVRAQSAAMESRKR